MDGETLTGRFVTLRPLRVGDAALTHHWRSGSRARLLNQAAGSVEQQAAWIRSRPANERNFVIERHDGLPVGMLSLVGIDPVNRHAEPGRFLIGDELAVRGLPAAVEAMKLLYELAFDRLDLVRVHGTIASENRRMITWQRYLGMREEGRMRQHYFIDGRFQDALIFALLVDEYRRDTLPRLEALIRLGQVAP
ncbi:GNAT family N-acetyltransferase [Sphingomonas sp. BK345]|uniref:GNAT family N-acetyltransferase n=1 Tax=Sphingomonas sp. BK345 TaxID=2586980 RepID=UPI001622A2EE|nr:GNAT family protein [Sphingomonas sp. BK345]MBB3475868.1 RimJ/RimL family protein N-acetyltransferase [Sphingomonas sp. BK345]